LPETRRSVNTTWALIREEHQDGILRFLLGMMRPIIEPSKKPSDDARMIAVILPGAESGA
jgi:hypothetical protein